MKVEVKVPGVGESVREALLSQWLKKDGEMVRRDEILFVIETDKVTLEVSAPQDGIVRILVEEGRTVAVGTVVATIDTEAGKEEPEKPASIERGSEAAPEPEEKAVPKEPEKKPAAPPQREPEPPPRPEAKAGTGPLVSPSARALAEKKGVDLSGVVPTGPGGRITEGDVLLFLEASAERAERVGEKAPDGREAEEPARPAPPGEVAGGRRVVRKPMSPIRRRIAERLLEAHRSTAMLTTFNEIDMSRVQALRKQFGESFRQKHGVRLGIMSFFIRASVAALREIPEANAFIEGSDILYHEYYHIGVAIGAQRGLVVPVIRDADGLGFAALERTIADFARKASENRLALSELEGGTFTISNGGVFGSLLSTPILNPPQSAILGMHKIEERPVAVEGRIEVRPMMYVAVTYDHRILDGRDAVAFLRRIKDCVENPERVMMEV